MISVSTANPIRPAGKTSGRKKAIILLTIGILLLFGLLLSQSSFDLPFLNPDTNQQLLFFATLSAVVFLLFVALTFVLARNLLKLFAERRLGVLGSKFRTRIDRKSTRLNSSHVAISYAVFCLKKKMMRYSVRQPG